MLNFSSLWSVRRVHYTWLISNEVVRWKSHQWLPPNGRPQDYGLRGWLSVEKLSAKACKFFANTLGRASPTQVRRQPCFFVSPFPDGDVAACRDYCGRSCRSSRLSFGPVYVATKPPFFSFKVVVVAWWIVESHVAQHFCALSPAAELWWRNTPASKSTCSGNLPSLRVFPFFLICRGRLGLECVFHVEEKCVLAAPELWSRLLQQPNTSCVSMCLWTDCIPCMRLIGSVTSARG